MSFISSDKLYNNYAFSVNDLHRKELERNENRKKIYNIVCEKCFKKIKDTSLTEEKVCFFRLPEYIPGLPIYNMTECVLFILDILKEKGFKARYVDPFMIFISWNIKKSVPKIQDKRGSIIDDLNLKYRPIEHYSGLSNFLPRKK
jgi:hypothetical protein